jgi:hypothetical protein
LVNHGKLKNKPSPKPFLVVKSTLKWVVFQQSQMVKLMIGFPAILSLASSMMFSDAVPCNSAGE